MRKGPEVTPQPGSPAQLSPAPSEPQTSCTSETDYLVLSHRTSAWFAHAADSCFQTHAATQPGFLEGRGLHSRETEHQDVCLSSSPASPNTLGPPAWWEEVSRAAGTPCASWRHCTGVSSPPPAGKEWTEAERDSQALFS